MASDDVRESPEADPSRVRQLVSEAPSELPEKVRVRIRWLESLACRREYERARQDMMRICLETGVCPPGRLFKAYKCIMFRAEALVGDRLLPVGYLLLVVNKSWDGIIYDVYVARAWRNMGIGTALVKAAVLMTAKKKGRTLKAMLPNERLVQVLRLYGADINVTACRRILEKNGFEMRDPGLYVIRLERVREQLAREGSR